MSIPEIDHLNCDRDWIELDFVKREETPEPLMNLGIHRHAAGLSLSDTISVLDTFGVERCRSTVYNWVKKTDLQPTDGKNPNHVAVVATFDWGVSFETNRPVTAMLADGLAKTLTYLVPAVVLSVILGVGAGVYSAIHRDSLGNSLAVGGGYLGFSLPNFWLAFLLTVVLSSTFGWYGYYQGDPELTDLLRSTVLPTFVLTTSLAAGQFRYARAESLEHVGSEFVKLVRAKGAGPFHVARHVLRNAALPLVALFFTDLLAVLVLNVSVVEAVFSIDGFGTVFYTAIHERDMPVIMGATMVVAFVGVGGTFLQDLLSAVLDPRVGEE